MIFPRFRSPSPSLPLNLQQRGQQLGGIPAYFTNSQEQDPLELFQPRNAAVLRHIFYFMCSDTSEENLIMLAAVVGYKASPTLAKANYIYGTLLADSNIPPRFKVEINAALQGGNQRGVRGRMVVHAASPNLFNKIIPELSGNVTDAMSRCYLRESSDGMHFYKEQVRGPRVAQAVQILSTMSRMGFTISQVLVTA
jgi:hypothetical protein